MRYTTGQHLPVPLPTDSAASGPALEALATAADAKLTTLDALSGFLRNPTAIASGGATGFPFAANTETAVMFGVSVFDNAAMIAGTDSLKLPTSDRRWWWYVGANIFVAAGAATNTLFTQRLYVDDTNPATGLATRKTLQRNTYSAGSGIEELLLDWSVLTGGGALRSTVTHAHTASLDFTGTCTLWATRVTPED